MSLKRGTAGVKQRLDASGESADGGGASIERHGGERPAALAGLEAVILGACAGEAEWPARVAAAIYAGVDFAIANPALARGLTIDDHPEGGLASPYVRLIARLTGFLRAKAPTETRLPASTDEALVAGIVGLVGDHIRIGRLDRLAKLRPELVLLTLLPYLGFSEAQRWANQVARSSTGGT
jgi:hypothetical protein